MYLLLDLSATCWGSTLSEINSLDVNEFNSFPAVGGDLQCGPDLCYVLMNYSSSFNTKNVDEEIYYSPKKRRLGGQLKSPDWSWWSGPGQAGPSGNNKNSNSPSGPARTQCRVQSISVTHYLQSHLPSLVPGRTCYESSLFIIIIIIIIVPRLLIRRKSISWTLVPRDPRLWVVK